METLFDPLDDITMSSAMTDDYTNQSTLSYLMSSQSRRQSTGTFPTFLLHYHLDLRFQV